tara:strand:+ start:1558 stop:1944 length:387 start_codon:yes stop_codon:yes gene_type:complete
MPAPVATPKKYVAQLNFIAIPPEKFLGFAELGQASPPSIGDVNPFLFLVPVPILNSLHPAPGVASTMEVPAIMKRLALNKGFPVSKHQQSLDVGGFDAWVVTDDGQNVFQVFVILGHDILRRILDYTL